jgi:16S rRNA (uracil1498-N3)-methyltransferase
VTPRFYAPGAARTGEIVELPAEEAGHLTRVLRLGAGAPIRIFNGRGREFEAVVDAAAKGRVCVRVGGAREAQAEARVAVTLAQAVIKGDRMDEVVRDAVMMGAAAVQPIVAARSETTLAALARGRRLARWERVAVAAAKQSGRATVPPILEPCTFADAVAALGRLALPGPGVMFVEPSAAERAQALGELPGPAPRETTVVIGPEGGWEPGEIEQGAAVCRLVTLGGRTLRADAMAIVALAALFAVWKEF